MAVNPVNNFSKLRLMGLSSGMETDTIIKQMLRLSQMRIDTRYRARTQLEWKQEALTNVGNLLTDFRWKYLTVMGPDAMRLSSVYNSTVATISGKFKDSVSVETSVNSPTGTMRIGEIQSLAKATSVSTSGNASRTGEGFKLTDKLGDIRVSNRPIEFIDGEARLNVNGTNIIINRAEMESQIADALRPDIQNIYDYMNTKIAEQGGRQIYFPQTFVPGSSTATVWIGNTPNEYTEIDVTTWGAYTDNKLDVVVNAASITIDLDQMQSLIDNYPSSGIQNQLDYVNYLISNASPPGMQIEFSEGLYESGASTTLTINGKTVNAYSDGDTIDRLLSRANALTGGLNFDENGKANIRINNVLIGLDKDMTIDDMLRKVNGSAAGVKMTYDRLSDMFTVENLKTGPSDLTVWGMEAFGIASRTENNGSLARVQINGEWLEKDSNTFDFRGVKITLNNTTGPVAAGEETVVALKRDATEAVGKIKSFFDGYNTLIKKLEDMLAERKTGKETSYGPLTEEEKSAMTEKQIEAWEEIAKKGLLRNESGLQSMIFELRSALYSTVKGVGLSPADIGIRTGSYYDGTGGQIILDEARLREALEADPERVMNVFMGGSDSTVSAERGLLWRMDDLMRGYTNGSQAVTLGGLENSIRRENEQIERLQKKMYDEEERLYMKFAAMETALSKLQEQSDWFMSMLNGNQQK